MLDTVTNTFALIGTIIFIGFLSEELYRKTKIPSVLILVLLGLMIGPITGYSDPQQLIEMTPIFAPIALMFILFEGGLNMNLFKILKSSPRALIFGVLNVVLSIFVCGILFNLIFGVDLMVGAIFGAIAAGTSAAMIEGMKIREGVYNFISIEAVANDILCIVLTISLVIGYTTGDNDLFKVGGTILSQFLVGTMFGLIAAVFWMKVLKKTRAKPFSYMIALATLFVVYSIADRFNGNGAIAVLVFGLILSNGLQIFEFFKIKQNKYFYDETLKKTHNEFSFFIRTFFYVYLGMIAGISNINIILIGIVITVLLFIIRALSTIVCTFKTTLFKNAAFIAAIGSKDLASVVLAQIPYAYGIENTNMFSELILVIVITSIFFSTVLVGAMNIRNSKK